MDRFEGFGKSTPLNPTVVGCTKDQVGRGKRRIIVDCITEDGPVPGALWTFSTQTTSKKVKKYDFPPVESAVTDEKAQEMQKIQKQNEHMEENLQASTSTKTFTRCRYDLETEQNHYGKASCSHDAWKPSEYGMKWERNSCRYEMKTELYPASCEHLSICNRIMTVPGQWCDFQVIPASCERGLRINGKKK